MSGFLVVSGVRACRRKIFVASRRLRVSITEPSSHLGASPLELASADSILSIKGIPGGRLPGP